MNNAQREILTDLIIKADVAFRKDSGKSRCEAIADYLLDHGTVVFPCKIGDTVFIIGRKYRAGKYETWINTGKFRLDDLQKLGKTVFLSYEDAQKALNTEIEKEKKTNG